MSAHGSADSVELEDEDGAPVPVTAQTLMGVLQHAGRTVPLIVLSSCSGGSADTGAMAAGLIERGADRVIAMLAPVTDSYATALTRRLYAELARPGMTAGQALAWAWRQAEQDRSGTEQDRAPLPEYGVATLLAAGADGPLVDPAASAAPLTVVTLPPGGTSVRELKLGALIGRRAELRTAMRVLRRTPDAVTQFGAASGIQVTGIGGIGKTAVVGRIITRLRADGWLIAVHEGCWNPTALITATIDAIDQGLPRIRNPAQVGALAGVRERLADPRRDDGPKLETIAGLLARHRLLVIFDDFEQNLAPGGSDFLDPAIGQAITALADGAETGALLVTCRYPLPGPDRFLARIPLPPLSAAELRRLFLRMPALGRLDPGDQRLLAAAIGGHPRLIEFTDALLRGGRASFRPSSSNCGIWPAPRESTCARTGR